MPTKLCNLDDNLRRIGLSVPLCSLWVWGSYAMCMTCVVDIDIDRAWRWLRRYVERVNGEREPEKSWCGPWWEVRRVLGLSVVGGWDGLPGPWIVLCLLQPGRESEGWGLGWRWVSLWLPRGTLRAVELITYQIRRKFHFLLKFQFPMVVKYPEER
jgi:hypothetical protein